MQEAANQKYYDEWVSKVNYHPTQARCMSGTAVKRFVNAKQLSLKIKVDRHVTRGSMHSTTTHRSTPTALASSTLCPQARPFLLALAYTQNALLQPCTSFLARCSTVCPANSPCLYCWLELLR